MNDPADIETKLQLLESAARTEPVLQALVRDVVKHIHFLYDSLPRFADERSALAVYGDLILAAEGEKPPWRNCVDAGVKWGDYGLRRLESPTWQSMHVWVGE